MGRTRLWICLSVALIAGIAVAQAPDWSNADFLQSRLNRTASAFTWPDPVASTDFKVIKETTGELSGMATIKTKGPMTEQEQNRAVLAAGMNFGATTAQGGKLTSLTVLLILPEKKEVVILPLKETTDLGRELLKDPRDDNAYKDAIFFFAGKCSWYEGTGKGKQPKK